MVNLRKKIDDELHKFHRSYLKNLLLYINDY